VVSQAIFACIISLKMEAVRTPETLVNFYPTTRLYNPEDSHLKNKGCWVDEINEMTVKSISSFGLSFTHTFQLLVRAGSPG
jgi:hypothetical protein